MARFRNPEIARMAAIAEMVDARMSITNFKPTIWSAQLLQHLRAVLVYAQNGVINRNYEGEIAHAGDTVHITGFQDPAVRTYTPNTDITFDTLVTSSKTMTVSQSDYFAFSVDDIDKRQALPGFIAGATQGAAYNLAHKVDAYVSGLMKNGVANGAGAGTGQGNDINGNPLPVNRLGTVAITATNAAYDLIVRLRETLFKANVPMNDLFLIVPPEFYSVLLRDERFLRVDTSGSSGVMRNGQVGNISSFRVIESNTVPVHQTTAAGVKTTHFTLIAGHPMATTFAQQITETESLRLQNQFGDGVKGLHLYGAKVIRPQALASATVNVASSVTDSTMLVGPPKGAEGPAPKGRKAAA